MAGSRSGPSWPAFTVVIVVLVAVAAAGFTALYRQWEEVIHSAELLQSQLAQSQRAQEDSSLQVSDQGQRLTTAQEDIESLIAAVGQLGERVETQSQNTIDPGAVLAEGPGLDSHRHLRRHTGNRIRD